MLALYLAGRIQILTWATKDNQASKSPDLPSHYKAHLGEPQVPSRKVSPPQPASHSLYCEGKEENLPVTGTMGINKLKQGFT